MNELERILGRLEPEEAMTALIPEIKKILAHLDQETRIRLVSGMLDEPAGDKISSMVNL